MLGRIYGKQGEERRSISLFREAAENQKKKYGIKHPKYAYALEELGDAYLEAGWHEDGMAALTDAVPIERELLGEENPKYLKTLEKLAGACYLSGEYEKAVKSYQKVNDLNFEETVEEQIRAAKKELQIANCYLKMGEREQSLAYHKKAVEKLKRWGALEDCDCVESIEEYTRGCLGMGRYQEAEALLKKTLHTREKKEMQAAEKEGQELSKESAEQKKNADTTKLLTVVYETRMEAFGDRDEEVLRAAIALGDLYTASKEKDEALKWYAKAEKEEGGKLYAEACQKAGILFLQSGQYHEARKKLEQSKRYLENHDLEKTKEYSEILGLLGDLFYAEKERDSALGFYEAWARLWKEQRGEKEASYIKRMGRIGSLLAHEGRNQEAVEYFSETALTIRKKEGENRKFAIALLNTGRLHLSLGKKGEGEVLLQKAALIYQEKEGKNSVSYGKFLEKLGNLYFEQKEYEKAQAFLEQAYGINQSQKEKDFLSKTGVKNLLSIYKEKKDGKKYFLVKLGKKIK